MIFFIFIQILIDHSVVNSRYPDKMLRSVASDLGLHCLPMPIKKDAIMLIWLMGLH